MAYSQVLHPTGRASEAEEQTVELLHQGAHYITRKRGKQEQQGKPLQNSNSLETQPDTQLSRRAFLPKRMMNFSEGPPCQNKFCTRGNSMCWALGGGSRESVYCEFLFPGDLHEVPELQLPPTEVGPPYCAPTT